MEERIVDPNRFASKQLADAVLLMGKSLIESGSELKRAEDTMNRLIQNSFFLSQKEQAEMYVYVTVNSIFLRQDKNDLDFVTISKRNFDLEKISCLNQLSREYSAGFLTVSELYRKIKQAMTAKKARPHLWWAYCLLSASITLILGGSFVECLIAAGVGWGTSQSFTLLKKIVHNVFLCEICSTFVGGSIGAIFCSILKLEPTLLYIAAIIPLVPGINLTNGVHDTFDSYYISGPVMILESLTTLVSLSLGITFLQVLPFGLAASGEISLLTVPLGFQLIGSALCSVSFAYMIYAPRKLFLPIGVAGAATWYVYVLISSLTSGSLFNNLLSIGLLSIISRYFAKRWKEPMTMFFIPGLVAVVPGITLFVGLNQWIMGQSGNASHTFSNVLISLLGLSIGSLVGDELYALLYRKRAK